MNYDLIIIGAGPGGYEAAIHAGKKGLTTLLIEKNVLGGVCLNSGCIPTKTLLASAHFWAKLKKANLFNIKIENPSIDYAKLIERKDRLVQRLQKGIEKSEQEANVTIKYGYAELHPNKTVSVDGEMITADHILLATGAMPGDVPGFVTDNLRVFNSTQILNLKTLPKSLGILGGGIIGLENADLFSSLGVSVTVYEMLPQLLPTEDQEAVEIIRKSLTAKGVKFQLGVKLNSAADIPEEKVLVAIGRKIPIEYIHEPAIKFGKLGEILVDDTLQTAPDIYAVGDCNNKALYAHAATYQGIKVVDSIIAEEKIAIDQSVMPKVIFTNPQVASVGSTTNPAKKFSLTLLGKAQVENQTEGFLKLYYNEKEQITGATIVAENADALIGEAVVLVKTKTTLAQLQNMIHPHPAWAEIFSKILK